jgi:hypothetical protein
VAQHVDTLANMGYPLASVKARDHPWPGGNPMPRDLITLSEAGRLLRLSTTQVRRLHDGGKIQGMRTPLGRVVFRESVERLARERATRKDREP